MDPKLIDTHTHVNFQAFREDADEVIERALDIGVWMINAGTQFDTSRNAVELAENYSDGVYAAVGLHPIHLFEHHVDEEETSFHARGEEFNIDSYKELFLRSAKIVAIGEFGLDYYRMPENEDPLVVKKVQREVLEQHLLLSKEVDKPVMIHCRDAYVELAEILKYNYVGTGEIHCFTGTWEEAKLFLEMGYYLAFNGIVTFDKSGQMAEVVRNTPIEQILLETDAPYLTPVPHRSKRNEPSFIKFTAEKIAEIKNMNPDEVAAMTTENARKLFKI